MRARFSQHRRESAVCFASFHMEGKINKLKQYEITRDDLTPFADREPAFVTFG